MAFIEIKPEGVAGNIFELIGKGWMLITGGTLAQHNTMTASWGGVGVLWGKNVSFCFIRPSRYTYEFVEAGDYYTLSFFEERFRPALVVCGGKSGREIDKDAETGLLPQPTPEGAVYYREAALVFVCRKLYTHDFDPGGFLVPDIEEAYPEKDYHRMYIGEIVRVLRDDEKIQAFKTDPEVRKN